MTSLKKRKKSKKKSKMRFKKRFKKRSKKRSNVTGFIYYKMSKCGYCKIFEEELLNDIINHCKKNKIKYHKVVREMNPELIPNYIKTYPSLVKYDENRRMKIFEGERTLANIKMFLK